MVPLMIVAATLLGFCGERNCTAVKKYVFRVNARLYYDGIAIPRIIDSVLNIGEIGKPFGQQ